MQRVTVITPHGSFTSEWLTEKEVVEFVKVFNDPEAITYLTLSNGRNAYVIPGDVARQSVVQIERQEQVSE
jgi:hypothetical protein